MTGPAVVAAAVAAVPAESDWIAVSEAASILGLSSAKGARSALSKLGFEPEERPTAHKGRAAHVWRRSDVERAVQLRRAAEADRRDASGRRKRPEAVRAAELEARKALDAERGETETLARELAGSLGLTSGGWGGPPSGIRLRDRRAPMARPVAESDQAPTDYGPDRVCAVCGRSGVSRYAQPDPVFADAVHSACWGLDGDLPAGWIIDPSGKVLTEAGDAAFGVRLDWISDWAEAGRPAAVAVLASMRERQAKFRAAAQQRSDRRVIEARLLPALIR